MRQNGNMSVTYVRNAMSPLDFNMSAMVFAVPILLLTTTMILILLFMLRPMRWAVSWSSQLMNRKDWTVVLLKNRVNCVCEDGTAGERVRENVNADKSESEIEAGHCCVLGLYWVWHERCQGADNDADT